MQRFPFLPSFPPILVLKFWPWNSVSIINRSWADRHKVSCKICCDVRLLTPSCAFGRCLGLVLFFEITLGTEDDTWGASVQPRASDSRWWRHILSLSVFRSLYHVAKIEKPKKNKTPFFPQPTQVFRITFYCTTDSTFSSRSEHGRPPLHFRHLTKRKRWLVRLCFVCS